MGKIILFSEYRINQGLFIQQFKEKNKYLSYDNIQISIYLYEEYLKICGIDNETLFKDIEHIRMFVIDSDMRTFDPDVRQNINDHIDKIITKVLLCE